MSAPLTTRPRPIQAQTEDALLSLRFSSLPERVRGWQTVPLEVEVTNHGLEALADPARHDSVILSLDLYERDGAWIRTAYALAAPDVVPLGETRRISGQVWIGAFEGPHDLFATGWVRDADDRQDAVLQRSEPARLEIQNKISEAYIELTNVCNFRCTFCPQGELQRKSGHMDLGLAIKVVEDLAAMGHQDPIRLHLLGEPLLYPHFREFIEAVHERGQRVRLATNGSRFQPERVEMIFETAVDEIVVSLNTPQKEEYDAQRGTKVAFETYMEEIEGFIAEVVRRGAPPHTIVNVLFDPMKAHLPEELERVRGVCERWVELVRELGGRPLPSTREIVDLDRPATYYDLTEGLQLQWTPYHRWGGGPSPDAHFCALPWQQLAVLVDGQVTACCIDSEGEMNMGDAKTSSVQEIWNGEGFARIRKGFREQHRATTALCARCEIAHERAHFFPNG